MRHPEGGYVLQVPRGMEIMEDAYGRLSLVVHFEESDEEPVAIMLTNYAAPGGAWVKGEDWLLEALNDGFAEKGQWGDCSDPQSNVVQSEGDTPC